jgi:antirestriction protein ArdC
MGYESPFWVTFKQARALGGYVRKGERSCQVIFWKWYEKDVTEPDTGETVEKKIPVLRYYSVFNIAQCDGIPEDKIPPQERVIETSFTPIEHCQHVIDSMPNRPEIKHVQARAFYCPTEDYVNLPRPQLFDTAEGYYAAAFHELTHSTGHESRLNRRPSSEPRIFGDSNYSREELVAEMGGSFLCGHTGIDCRTIDNSAAYIAGWLRRLRDDAKLVVVAAAQAQKAANYILGKQSNSETETEPTTVAVAA